MSELILKVGQKFEDQIERANTPNTFEGLVYEGDAGLYMFCQIAVAKFTFIYLKEGNREIDGVQFMYPDLGGCNTRGVLRKLQKEMDQTLTYVGTIDTLLGK